MLRQSSRGALLYQEETTKGKIYFLHPVCALAAKAKFD